MIAAGRCHETKMRYRTATIKITQKIAMNPKLTIPTRSPQTIGIQKGAVTIRKIIAAISSIFSFCY